MTGVIMLPTALSLPPSPSAHSAHVPLLALPAVLLPCSLSPLRLQPLPRTLRISALQPRGHQPSPQHPLGSVSPHPLLLRKCCGPYQGKVGVLFARAPESLLARAQPTASPPFLPHPCLHPRRVAWGCSCQPQPVSLGPFSSKASSQNQGGLQGTLSSHQSLCWCPGVKACVTAVKANPRILGFARK